jgi:hypothetical protein
MKTKLNSLMIVFLLFGLVFSSPAQNASAQDEISLIPNAVYGIYSTHLLTAFNEGVRSWAETEDLYLRELL